MIGLVLSFVFTASADSDSILQLKSGKSDEIEKARVLIERKATVLAERNRIINDLGCIIQDKNMREKNISAVVGVIDILGDIQAVESVPYLLDMVNYSRYFGEQERPHGTDRIVVPLEDTPDPNNLGKHFPCVPALVKMRVPSALVVDRLREENNPTRQECFIGILIGTESRDIAEVIVKRAADFERRPEAKDALESALKWFAVYDSEILIKSHTTATTDANH